MVRQNVIREVFLFFLAFDQEGGGVSLKTNLLILLFYFSTNNEYGI